MPKILLVEDNEMNRDMLSRRLIKRGFELVIAVTGEEGLNLAQEVKADLILLDLSLPVIDGWEVARRIRAIPAIAKIPIIALSAHALTEDRDRAIKAGCDDYDTKPVEIQRLLGKIDAMLARPPAAMG